MPRHVGMSTQNHAAEPFQATASHTNNTHTAGCFTRANGPSHQWSAPSHQRDAPSHQRSAPPRARPGQDPAERVALVLAAKRALLLNTHRHRLRKEDLEDCLSQAALELVVRARQGLFFASQVHLARMLEQRFLSRINDRRRAIEGRSTAHAEFENAIRSGLLHQAEEQVADPRAEVEPLVLLRLQLSRVGDLASQLSRDQRLVLHSQLHGIDRAELCASLGWSAEKYRKVAQRGRARLRLLLDADLPPARQGTSAPTRS